MPGENIEFWKKSIFLAYVTPMVPMGSRKKMTAL